MGEADRKRTHHHHHHQPRARTSVGSQMCAQHQISRARARRQQEKPDREALAASTARLSVRLQAEWNEVKRNENVRWQARVDSNLGPTYRCSSCSLRLPATVCAGCRHCWFGALRLDCFPRVYTRKCQALTECRNRPQACNSANSKASTTEDKQKTRPSCETGP